MAEGSNQDQIPADYNEDKVISKKRKRALAKKKAIEEKYHAPTKQLKLAGRSMTSLDHFPMLLQLEELDLSDNALENGLEALIESTPKISILDLTGNKFSEIESLKPLANLENLKNLSVFDCPLTTNENYRTQIYELLPNLIILDGFDKDEKELKNNESKTEIQQPSNSQEEKKPESSSGEEGKIYKKFLKDRAASDDESNDDDFNPSNDVSNNTENTSESTSEKDDDEDTSSRLSDSGKDSKNSRSEDEQETDEPRAKRIHTDSNED